MEHLTPPEYLARADGVRLAVRRMAGTKGKFAPTLVFLPGYLSDMQGSKAVALEAWAIRTGYPMVRFDYSGCGESEGAFDAETLASWRDDTLLVIEMLVRAPVVLVGSSMGGWLMLLVALQLQSQVAGLVGIAAAPDFTDWGFSDVEKASLSRGNTIYRDNIYGPEPTPTTAAFWQAGQANRLLTGPIAIDCPVRLLQGQQDPDVPWETALRLGSALRSADVQLQLIKDGDHRLSREADIALLIATVEQLMDQI
jgi:pimeloyl-ACP methyl ester carboxylesterase